MLRALLTLALVTSPLTSQASPAPGPTETPPLTAPHITMAASNASLLSLTTLQRIASGTSSTVGADDASPGLTPTASSAESPESSPGSLPASSAEVLPLVRGVSSELERGSHSLVVPTTQTASDVSPSTDTSQTSLYVSTAGADAATSISSAVTSAESSKSPDSTVQPSPQHPEDPSCPERCWCGPAPLEMECRLPRDTVTVSGKPGAYVSFTCEDGVGFSCGELPPLPPAPAGAGGAGGADGVRVELAGCPAPPLACLAPALPGPLQELYLKYPPRASLAALSPSTVRGLHHVRKFAVYGQDGDAMSVPREMLRELGPSLTSLTINKARLSLRADDFSALPQLTYLELSATGFKRLPDGVFRSLTKLQKLYIWMNDIEELTEEQLEGLQAVKMVDVNRNRLRSLAGLARSLPALTALSAFANRIQELPRLTNVTGLQVLSVFDNRAPLALPPAALAALAHLTDVNLARSGIQRLPEDLLAGSAALQRLDLSGNQLRTLPLTVFHSQAALRQLDLSANLLEELSPGVFHGLQALKQLKLNKNRLVTLPSNVFWGLSSLSSLQLSHNRLRRLAGGVWGGARSIDQLDLSHNNLTDDLMDDQQYAVFCSSFSQLEGLRTLSLSHNGLRAPPAALPATAVFLLSLDLTHNLISELLPDDVTFSSRAATVDYRHNRLARVRLERGRAAPAGRRQPPDQSDEQSRVLLGHNPFHCDCRLYQLVLRFRGYRPPPGEARLVADDAACGAPAALAGRPLAALDPALLVCPLPAPSCPPSCVCVFRPHWSSLELTCSAPPPSYPSGTDVDPARAPRLHLALTRAPRTPVTAALQLLNISGLALTEVPLGALPARLARLDLTRNNLTRLPEELLQRNLTLRLAGNKIPCDCWHRDDVALLQEYWWKIEDYDRLNCTDEVPLGAVNVGQLCSTWRAGLVGGVLAGLAVVTVAAAALVLRYSLEIRVWLYARGWFARWFVIDDDDRKYDAFVSFCHEDEQFVTQHLLPGLEAPPRPYKLCVHHRDWLPGQWIPAQIAQSVSDSRRTLVVVSRRFLASLWGRAEFRTANMSAVKEHRARVIVVLLEDVSGHEQLDAELKAYLATNTYLRWGDPCFWDKLRYALPHRKVDTSPASRTRHKLAKVQVAKKLVGATCGLDARLAPGGLIVNAAALSAADKRRSEMIHLHIRTLNNKKLDGLGQLEEVGAASRGVDRAPPAPGAHLLDELHPRPFGLD